MVAPHFHPDDPDLAAAKAAMRARALSSRDAARAEGAADAVARAALLGAPPMPGDVVAGFWPMGGELDVRPLLRALAGRGHRIALPRTPRRGSPLSFHLHDLDRPLEPGPFGTSQPAADAPAIRPDFVIVPLLAFDRRGRRLGYGGGYYDRTLDALPAAFRLGVAYAAQEVGAVPTGRFDVTLDAVATEADVFHVEARRA